MVLIDKQQHDYTLGLGDPMPVFSLKGTDGEMHSSADLKPVAIIAFWCNHCPYVIAAEKRFVEIATKFASIASFVAISSNDPTNYPEDSFENMQKKKYPFPYLFDATQEVARAFGAECTPHVFLFKDGTLAYQGRVDNAGKGVATSSDLLEAVIAITQGRKPPKPLTAAMGCSIKWKY